jgi:endonuclease/exonuclease/phosphatase family metal-dependent hydrolase
VPAAFPDHNAEGHIRVLHWNVHSWQDEAGTPNVDVVADLVRDIAPDAVSLVEVDESWAAASCLGAVAERCGYASIFAPSFEYGQQQPAGGFGNALLTKVPISVVRQRQLVWPTTVYDGSEPSELRSVTLAKMGSFWVGSTHLPRGSAKARTAALRRLISVAGELDGAWLVCGDFNTPASSWLSRADAVVTAPRPAQATHPADKPVEAIDYCLASSGVSLDAEVLDTSGSDHLPVLVTARRGV